MDKILSLSPAGAPRRAVYLFLPLPAEILPSLRSALLRSSISLRSTQDDTGGRSSSHITVGQ